MFIPLEGEKIVSLENIIAFVRSEKKTAIFLKDGSIVSTGFRPETLAKRYRTFGSDARQRMKVLQQEGDQ